MNELLTQIMVAARSRKSKDMGWVQVLVFVVVAIVYAIGSVLRARANKIESKDEEQLGPERTGKAVAGTRRIQPRRAVGPAPGRQYRPQVGPPRRKIVRPQPVAQMFSVKLAAEEEPAIVEQAQPELGLARSVIPKELKVKPLVVSRETPGPEVGFEGLLDFADPEDLKRAILHYEILGKPMSLRGPSEQIIGL